MSVWCAVARVRSIPPVVLVLVVATGAAGLVAVARYHAHVDVDARVRFARARAPRVGASASEGAPVRAGVEDAPAFREAYRVEEVSGIALALSLVAVEARLARRPLVATVGALVDAARVRDLLPPGLRVTRDGALESEYATLYVRYRPDPVGVEVVSIPRRSIDADGAPMLARVTAEEGAARYASLRETTPIEIPAPFEPEAALEAARWKRESLRVTGGEHARPATIPAPRRTR